MEYNFLPEHTYTFSPTTVDLMLKKIGFRIIKFSTFGYVTDRGLHHPYMDLVARKIPRQCKGGLQRGSLVSEETSGGVSEAEWQDTFRPVVRLGQSGVRDQGPCRSKDLFCAFEAGTELVLRK